MYLVMQGTVLGGKGASLSCERGTELERESQAWRKNEGRTTARYISDK
jgi:hypothetical protein